MRCRRGRRAGPRTGNSVNPDTPNVSYRHYWGKNVGKEAGTLLVESAVSRLNLRRIHCATHGENVGMQKLALSLGMREEGRRKEAVFKNGVYADVVEYGMIVPDRPSSTSTS